MRDRIYAFVLGFLLVVALIVVALGGF